MTDLKRDFSREEIPSSLADRDILLGSAW
jgi:hypothetical protein